MFISFYFDKKSRFWAGKFCSGLVLMVIVIDMLVTSLNVAIIIPEMLMTKCFFDVRFHFNSVGDINFDALCC